MDRPDVLLITPPFDFTAINSASGRTSRQGGYYIYYPPIGLCSIAAVLEKAGFSAGIIDGFADAPGEHELVSMVRACSPKLIGISVTTPSLPIVKRIADRLGADPGVPIVAGGPHISTDPDIVDSLGVDYGVVGDGEEPMKIIAGHVLRGENLPGDTPGLVLPGGGAPAAPSQCDLDALPLPARRLLKNPGYYFNPFAGEKTTIMLTARGCPYHCSFCSRNPSMGPYRPLDESRALDEMQAITTGGYGFVSIIDETFTFDRDRCIRIARGMRRRGIDFLWSCQTRADLADRELISELAAAGCINISFGLEAGDEDVRDGLDKHITDEDFEAAFDACRRAGVSTNAFLIIGSPGETAEQVGRSISRAIRLRPDYAVYNIGTLFPGTREYTSRLDAGEIDRGIWDRYMNGIEPLPVLSRTLGRSELAALLRRGYSRFYLRPGYVIQKLSRIRSMRDVSVLARQARTVVRDYVVPGE